MVKEYLMAVYVDEGQNIYYTALHRQVLVAYVTCIHTMTYRAYIFPVPGMRHEDEARLWRTEGQKLAAGQAKGMWPVIDARLEQEGYSYSSR